MQVQIKFRVGGANSMHGGFSAGDLMRCDAAIGAHYVAEGIAEYVKAPPAAVPVPEEKPAAKAKKK